MSENPGRHTRDDPFEGKTLGFEFQSAPPRNTWNGSPQRELTTNPLSGRLGADQPPREVMDELLGMETAA